MGMSNGDSDMAVPTEEYGPPAPVAAVPRRNRIACRRLTCRRAEFC